MRLKNSRKFEQDSDTGSTVIGTEDRCLPILRFRVVVSDGTRIPMCSE